MVTFKIRIRMNKFKLYHKMNVVNSVSLLHLSVEILIVPAIISVNFSSCFLLLNVPSLIPFTEAYSSSMWPSHANEEQT